MTGVRCTGGARRVLEMVCLGMATLACSRTGTGSEPEAAPLARMSAAELRAVPVSASLDLPLQASVYAWRDFMPIAGTPSNARGLTVSVQLRGGVVPPRVLACAGIHVASGDSVFMLQRVEQRAGDGPGAIECVMRGGPAWPVGSALQVITSVRAGVQRTFIRRETTIDVTS